MTLKLSEAEGFILKALKPTEEGFDPRVTAIQRRLASIKLITPVMSPKGGVGKTLVACLLALKMADKGAKVGLLDLDITNPTAHMMLGMNVAENKPIEDKGVVPPKFQRISFMTIAYYVGEEPLPLRGADVDNVIKEVLAVTIWNSLDSLLMDLPPGLSDETLDILELLEKPRPVVVTTADLLSLKSVEKLLKLLDENGVKPLGVVENMSRGDADTKVLELCKQYSVKFLGALPFDHDVGASLGNAERLSRTKAAQAVEAFIDEILKEF